MGKKKKKKRSQRVFQTKNKDATVDKANPNHTLRVAAVDALSSGWVQNSVIAALGMFVLLIVAMATKTQIKTAAISFGLMATAALWIFVAVVVLSVREPGGVAISLLFRNFDGSHRADMGAFWCRYPSGFGDTLSPASAALYLTIKNRTTSPLYIERLEISVQKHGEEWQLLRQIPTEECRWYWIYGDIRHARLLEMDGIDVRSHSSIPGGETILGWIFLATTKEYPVKQGDKLRWRFRVRDSAGTDSEYVSEYEEVNNKPAIDPSAKQPVPIKATGVIEDLSKLYFRVYEPIPYQ